MIISTQVKKVAKQLTVRYSYHLIPRQIAHQHLSAMFAAPLLKKGGIFGAVALSSAACYQYNQKKSLGARSSSVLAFGGDAGATGVSVYPLCCCAGYPTALHISPPPPLRVSHPGHGLETNPTHPPLHTPHHPTSRPTPRPSLCRAPLATLPTAGTTTRSAWWAASCLAVSLTLQLLPWTWSSAACRWVGGRVPLGPTPARISHYSPPVCFF